MIWQKNMTGRCHGELNCRLPSVHPSISSTLWVKNQGQNWMSLKQEFWNSKSIKHFLMFPPGSLFSFFLLKIELQTLQQTWGNTHCPHSLFSWTCGRMNVLPVCSWVFSLFSLLVEAWCIALWCNSINIMGPDWSPQDTSLREKCENLLFPFSGDKNWGLLKSRFLRWFGVLV